jgi:uncharacterized membrane protein
MDHFEKELKKEFQLERMILFSDAVFAIAITILILEIKVPELHENVSDDSILEELGKLVPKFIGFLISFFLIGQYWSVHHRIFGFVTRYDRKLLWKNLYFLLTIVIMPFTTGLYSEYTGTVMFEKQLKVPMTIYAINIALTAFTNYRLWSYIANPKNNLASGIPGKAFVQMVKLRASIVPFCFILMLPIAYLIDVRYAVYMPMLIPFLMIFVRKRYERKAAKETKS